MLSWDWGDKTQVGFSIGEVPLRQLTRGDSEPGAQSAAEGAVATQFEQNLVHDFSTWTMPEVDRSKASAYSNSPGVSA